MTLEILMIFKPQSLSHHQLRQKVKLQEEPRLKVESIQVYQSLISAQLLRVASSKSLLIVAGQMSISNQVLCAQIIIMFKVLSVRQQVRNLSGRMIGPKTMKIKMNCLNRLMQIMGLIVMNLETLMSGKEVTSHLQLTKNKNRRKLRRILETLLQMTIQRKVSKKVPVSK